MTMQTFQVPATIICGAGARKELPAQVRRLGAERILLVTDPFFAGSGLAAEFVAMLAAAGIQAQVFHDVQPDPTDKNVAAGLVAFRRAEAQAIVAVGGGSPMDCAKAIAVLTTNGEPLRQYKGYHQIPRAGAPLICIPTTAGTGSEATKVAVITDTERDEKMMILDIHLLPAVALVDYELSLSMPKPLTAWVGVDTLTHGIEAYVSRKAGGLSDPIALSCIGLAAQNLQTAWNQPDHREARAAMALSALHGGMAFANSSVCLVHGMSRPLGAVFHLPHGLANAVLLPTVTRFSLPGAPGRYATVARTMGLAAAHDSDAAAGQKLVQGLEELNIRLEVPRLGQCKGMERQRFDAMVQKMAADALASGSPQNNPVVPTAEQIVTLYQEAW